MNDIDALAREMRRSANCARMDRISLGEILAILDDRDALRARVEKLEAALKPFSELSEYGEEHYPEAFDNNEIGISIGLLRRARAALNPPAPEKDTL